MAQTSAYLTAYLTPPRPWLVSCRFALCLALVLRRRLSMSAARSIVGSNMTLVVRGNLRIARSTIHEPQPPHQAMAHGRSALSLLSPQWCSVPCALRAGLRGSGRTAECTLLCSLAALIDSRMRGAGSPCSGLAGRSALVQKPGSDTSQGAAAVSSAAHGRSRFALGIGSGQHSGSQESEGRDCGAHPARGATAAGGRAWGGGGAAGRDMRCVRMQSDAESVNARTVWAVNVRNR